MSSFKKISDLAKRFEIKLAQFYYGDTKKMPWGEATKYDPLYGGPVDPKNVKPQTNVPAQVKPMVAPAKAPLTQAPVKSALPADLTGLLDRGVPGLKGALFLTATPGSNIVDVKYNMNNTKYSAEAIKRMVGNAIGPTYRVSETVVGGSYMPNY
jgi:hypothetical protein